MSFNNIFITVGTTKFDNLINYCSSNEMLSIFTGLKCKKLVIQNGVGDQDLLKNFKHFEDSGIELEYYTLKESIIDDIKNADLVISHAGAGTCLEVLNIKRPLIVVVNEDLMDNHQTELAEQLASENYCLYCTVKTLKETLTQNLDVKKLKKYESGSAKNFVEFLDNLMGF